MGGRRAVTRPGTRVTPSMFRCRRGAAVQAVAAFVIAGASGLAAEPRISVDLELVLAVDTSASVDSREFDLQMTGLADAFRDPVVIAAVRRPGGIAVALVQWGGPGSQAVSVGWAHVFDADSAARFADAVAGSRRLFLMEETAIAPLLYFAERLFDDNGFDGRRRVIDVSGDGPDNSGIDPSIMRDWVQSVHCSPLNENSCHNFLFDPGHSNSASAKFRVKNRGNTSGSTGGGSGGDSGDGGGTTGGTEKGRKKCNDGIDNDGDGLIDDDDLDCQ